MKYIFILILSTLLFGQRYDNIKEADWNDRKKRPARIENMVVWRLTNDLELSTEQAENFFPRFRSHRKDIEKISDDEREVYNSIRKKASGDDKVTKSDVKAIVESIAKLRKKRIDLESDFILDMDGVLSPEQLIRLSVFKHSLMSDMKNEMRGKKEKSKRKRGRKRMKRGFNHGRF